MRLATYNVENLFQRAKAMNLDSWDEGKPILEDFHRLNMLIQEAVYDGAIKSELLEIMKKHPGLLSKKQESKYMILRQLRSGLFSRPKGKPTQIKANGKDDWLGWFELKRGPVKAVATKNTAIIIGKLKADVLCVVEAEDRIGLKRFNDEVISKEKALPFEHVMLIDGNDDRGIDVGVMTKAGYEIINICSHVDDRDEEGEIFSRDCAEYVIRTAKGNALIVLLNHFKSKIGSKEETEHKRWRQAKRVRDIYDKRRADGFKHVAILGDMNEPPDNYPMSPLTGGESSLTDIMRHSKFLRDEHEGTWGEGYPSQKFDYILMSPELSSKVSAGGIVREGVWAGEEGNRFHHLPTIKSARDAASDHAALWAEFDL